VASLNRHLPRGGCRGLERTFSPLTAGSPRPYAPCHAERVMSAPALGPGGALGSATERSCRLTLPPGLTRVETHRRNQNACVLLRSLPPPPWPGGGRRSPVALPERLLWSRPLRSGSLVRLSASTLAGEASPSLEGGGVSGLQSVTPKRDRGPSGLRSLGGLENPTGHLRSVGPEGPGLYATRRGGFSAESLDD